MVAATFIYAADNKRVADLLGDSGSPCVAGEEQTQIIGIISVIDGHSIEIQDPLILEQGFANLAQSSGLE